MKNLSLFKLFQISSLRNSNDSLHFISSNDTYHAINYENLRREIIDLKVNNFTLQYNELEFKNAKQSCDSCMEFKSDIITQERTHDRNVCNNAKTEI